MKRTTKNPTPDSPLGKMLTQAKRLKNIDKGRKKPLAKMTQTELDRELARLVEEIKDCTALLRAELRGQS